MPGLGGIDQIAQTPAPAAPEPPPENRSERSWLPWALLAGLAALVLFGPRMCASPSTPGTPQATVGAPQAAVGGAPAKADTDAAAKSAGSVSPAAETAAVAPVESAATPTPSPAAPVAAPAVATIPGDMNFARGTLGARLLRFMKSSAQGSRTFSHHGFRFRTDSNALAPASETSLKAVASILAAYPNAKVEFVGHTDSRGSRAVNKALSESRAKAVADALVAAGVSADRVSSSGAGEAQPVAPNTTVKGRRANRRVELVVTKP
jgi:outer membrane protein OmpA-like peptidoglycan-associated protein